MALIEAPFSDFAEELLDKRLSQFDGVVMDIGVSSMQLDQAARGFSFMKDGPLDMRMGQAGLSAADVVSKFSAERLADIIYVFGDEPTSRAIGRAIVKARGEAPIETTRQLVAAIERATGRTARICARTPRPRPFRPCAFSSMMSLGNWLMLWLLLKRC